MKRPFTITAAFAVIALLTSSAAQAQIHTLTVTVEGMSCPFCAYGVEKKLKKVEGVESVEISMKEGTAALTAKKGQSINIGRVPKTVRDAGFSPGTITIAAIGTVRMDEQKRLFLQFEGRSLLVTEVKDSVRERLISLAGSGRPTEIRGIARENPDRTWAVSPEWVKEM